MSLFHPKGNHANRMRRVLLEKMKRTPEMAIFARYEHSDDYDYYIDLFKLDLTEKISESNFRRKLRLNKTGPKLHNWVFDSKGWRLAGTRTVDDVTELFARTGSKPRKYRYKSVWESKKGDVLKVVGGNASRTTSGTNAIF